MSTSSSESNLNSSVIGEEKKQEEKIFATIPEALEEIRNGGIVIVMDDEDRENEGDLIMAAEKATPEKMAFFVNYTTGILCAPMPAARATELQLPLMVNNSTDPNKTAYTISCDSASAGTGVSAADRCLTFNQLADYKFKASAFRRPGHIFPLIAKPGGVWERRGHTEASLDLCRLAGVSPVGVIGELVNKDGSMKRLPDCINFAKKYNLKIITIEALLLYRLATEPELSNAKIAPVKGVEFIAQCKLPIRLNGEELGVFGLMCFYSHFDGRHHIALERGDVTTDEPVLTRVHSECFTGDILGSQRCDCGEQLARSLELIAERGRGVLVYNVGHEGRGIGLANKIMAYFLQQNHNMDTYKANQALGFEDDLRKYDTANAIIRALGVKKVQLLTSNTTKASAFGDLVDSTLPLEGTVNEHNALYLTAKRKHFGQAPLEFNPECAHSHQHGELANAEPSLKSPPVNLSATFVEPQTMRIALVRASWNYDAYLEPLATGIKKTLLSYIDAKHFEEFTISGSGDLPYAVNCVAKTGDFDVVIALGLLIKGDSDHYKYVSSATVHALQQVALATDVPVTNGVLNCRDEAQAKKRCIEDGDLAKSLAEAALNEASFKRTLAARKQQQ